MPPPGDLEGGSGVHVLNRLLGVPPGVGQSGCGCGEAREKSIPFSAGEDARVTFSVNTGMRWPAAALALSFLCVWNRAPGARSNRAPGDGEAEG